MPTLIVGDIMREEYTDILRRFDAINAKAPEVLTPEEEAALAAAEEMDDGTTAVLDELCRTLH